MYDTNCQGMKDVRIRHKRKTIDPLEFDNVPPRKVARCQTSSNEMNDVDMASIKPFVDEFWKRVEHNEVCLMNNLNALVSC